MRKKETKDIRKYRKVIRNERKSLRKWRSVNDKKATFIFSRKEIQTWICCSCQQHGKKSTVLQKNPPPNSYHPEGGLMSRSKVVFLFIFLFIPIFWSFPLKGFKNNENEFLSVLTWLYFMGTCCCMSL
jgi:hypothetical protein